MTLGPQKLSATEKIGYSLGDAAANFVFMTMILFQLNFYTDTFGITAAAAGTLLLVGRLWDAFFDPLMGVLADRTNTRWGKFRPWVLWTALPWGIVMYLAYTTPNLSPTAKLIYAFVTNILLMTLYSANNTPYSAMTGVMTGDVNERTSLSSYRFVAAMIAQLIVGGFTLPLVAKFGQGDNAKGWQMTMGLWAIVCVVLFVITFLTTRERIHPDPEHDSANKQDLAELKGKVHWFIIAALALAGCLWLLIKSRTIVSSFVNEGWTFWAVLTLVRLVALAIFFVPLWQTLPSSAQQDMASLRKHGPWVAMFVLTLAHFIVLSMRGGTMYYYFDYYLDETRMLELLQGLGLDSTTGGIGHYLLDTFGLVLNENRTNVASVGFSLFNMSSQFVTVVGVAFSTYLSIRFGKKAVAILGFMLTTIFMAMFALLPRDAVGTAFVLEWVRALCYAPTIPLLWAMFADVVDYAEWKTGRRTTGVIFATILFALKAGLSLGGFLAGQLLELYGYKANVEQTADALRGIRLTISLYPAVFFGICVACLAFYRISKHLNLQIQDELAERRHQSALARAAAGAKPPER